MVCFVNTATVTHPDVDLIRPSLTSAAISKSFKPLGQSRYSFLGLSSSSECDSCTAGEYCGSAGLNRTSGPCEQGYYCPIGSSNSRPVPCGQGAYCPTGSRERLLCEPGTFQPNDTRWMKSQCLTCTPGLQHLYTQVHRMKAVCRKYLLLQSQSQVNLRRPLLLIFLIFGNSGNSCKWKNTSVKKCHCI